MKDCIFCDHSNIDSIEELLDDVYMFTPLNPVVPGHKLFISREHSKNAGDNPDIYANVSRVAARYGFLMRLPYNLITSSGKEATQSIFHLHVHYVPRTYDDGLKLPWTDQAKEESK